ncbi:YaaA family protein [Blastomonas sp.]|uniref:YaaA family protein n=1 Tax=Blastomonas sp. TaxID=1909299 RepID=UPI003919FBC3
MIILLSPAKSLDFDSPVPAVDPSPPRFAPETERLVRSAARLSKARLKQIMPVSDALIDLNYGRYREFFDQPERAAAFAFNGDVYSGLAARTLDDPALEFAQRHVRILSGLYGLLRPFDPIRPYRLEMGTRWAPRHASLVAFWGDRIASAIAEDLDAAGSDTVINLASQEYFAAADKGLKKRKVKVITADFRQQGPDGPRFVSFDAKRARGMAARFLCEHRHASPQALKGFDSDGYRFDPESSDETVWRFIRA